MATLMLDAPTDKRVSFSDLFAVDANMPDATDTYQPVAHSHFVTQARTIFAEALNMEVLDTHLGLARNGAQMFGVLTFRNEARPDIVPAVGLRNAHDKSMALGTCGGASVFVCSNMCFSGDSFTIMRKHSNKIMEALPELLGMAAHGFAAQYRDTLADLDAFRGIPMDVDDGFAELGRMIGHGAITSVQLSRALDYWREPPHAEHTNRDLFGLYQAVNHGLKNAHPTKAFQAHGMLHHRALELSGRLPEIEDAIEVDVIDAEPLDVDAF